MAPKGKRISVLEERGGRTLPAKHRGGECFTRSDQASNKKRKPLLRRETQETPSETHIPKKKQLRLIKGGTVLMKRILDAKWRKKGGGLVGRGRGECF